MSKHKPKISLRNLFSILGIIGLGIVVLFSRGEFTSFWRLLSNLRWYIIVLVIIIQIASYWLNAMYYRSILRIFSFEVTITRLFEGALAANFVNYIVPTIGLAGAGYLSEVLKPEVPRGVSVLVQFMRYALSGLAVLVMLPVGFLLILTAKETDHAIVKLTIAAAIGIAVLVIVLVALVQQETALRRLVDWLMRGVKRVYPKFKSEVNVRKFIGDFYVGYRIMTKSKLRMLIPFAWSIVYILVEIATFYLAFLAFGKIAALGVVVMAYLFANITAIFGGVFFSTGIFELGMIGTLVTLGTPFSLAFAITTVYRVLNLLIGLPPGYFYYRKYLPKT